MYEPKNLTEFIGQTEAVNQVSLVLEAAKAQGIACPHMIFFGNPGLGKTAMGKLIAGMMDSKMYYCIGKTFNPQKELVRLEWKDILFIDEIHRVQPAVEEIMYEPMSDWHMTMPDGLYGTSIEIAPFTLIGATTLLGKVTKPLRDRCRLNVHFQPYPNISLARILVQAALKNELKITKAVPMLLAKMSRGVPRIALRLLEMCQDIVIVHDYDGVVTANTVDEMSTLLEIDADGLAKDDIAYMKVVLESNRPIGNKAIAKTLSVDDKTVSEVIEPFLIEQGYVLLTSTGRVLTGKGLARVRGKGRGR